MFRKVATVAAVSVLVLGSVSGAFAQSASAQGKGKGKGPELDLTPACGFLFSNQPFLKSSCTKALNGAGYGHCRSNGLGHVIGKGKGHEKDDDCPVSV